MVSPRYYGEICRWYALIYPHKSGRWWTRRTVVRNKLVVFRNKGGDRPQQSREVLSRVKGRNLFRHLILPRVVCPLRAIESLSFLFILTHVTSLINHSFFLLLVVLFFFFSIYLENIENRLQWVIVVVTALNDWLKFLNDLWGYDI